jgi:enoyl-[acyl-carrier protein] reductase I
LSELAGGVTGETHYVDSGFNIILQPRPDKLDGE